MRRSTRTQDDETWRVAVIPVRLSGADHRRAHEACHKAALLWNFLLAETRAYWGEHGSDPSDKELRHRLYEKQPDLRDGLHAHTIQGVLDGMNDAVATYRENRRQGNMDAHAPHRAKNYRPLDFTAGYGWRPTNDGKHIALSFGRNHKRILVRMPNISDPKTNAPVPVGRWGAMRLCWDSNKRQWSLHVSVPTSRPPQGDPSNVAAIDEGIINPMSVAIETDDAYEIRSSTDVTREPSNITATQESPAFRRNCPVASKGRNGGANSTRNAGESNRKPPTPCVTPTIRPPARSPTSFRNTMRGES